MEPIEPARRIVVALDGPASSGKSSGRALFKWSRPTSSGEPAVVKLDGESTALPHRIIEAEKRRLATAWRREPSRR